MEHVMAGAPLRELAEIVRLKRGRHRHPTDGVCAMELVAWMAGEKHTDRPWSASPVIAEFTRSLNDALDGAQRQRLGALAARMVGSRGTPVQELARVQLLWDWMITTSLPAWLDAAGRDDLAANVARGRAPALGNAIVAIGAHAHVQTRPAGDHRTAADVTRALDICGLTAACLSGGQVADTATGSRARRHWNDAHVLGRAAAWYAAEASGSGSEHAGRNRFWQTTHALRESAFLLVDRMISVTEPPAVDPPPPPPVDCAVVRQAQPPDLLVRV
jgi:hypothetical protein